MTILTNNAGQVVQPGQAVVFSRVIGKDKCCGNGLSPSGTSAKLANGNHTISFHANVGGAAGTQANLAIALSGETIAWTNMATTITADTDVHSLSISFPLEQCCCDFDRVSVVNTGTTPVTVAPNPMLAIDRHCN